MGIQVEFNPDLALRAHQTPGRRKAECLPEKLELKKIYPFLKKGQRNYWFQGEIPLVETKGNQELSRPLASIRIVNAIHFRIDGEVYTKGLYEIVKVYNPQDKKIHFEGFNKVE